MTADLVAFLQARLDETERRARATPGPSWEHRQIRSDVDESVIFEDYVAVADPERNTVVLADIDRDVLPFVLEHDPARVLAEVAAKRRILAEHAPDAGDCRVCTDPEFYSDDADGNRTTSRSAKAFPCLTLRLLTLPYAERPGYRPEWAPGG